MVGERERAADLLLRFKPRQGQDKLRSSEFCLDLHRSSRNPNTWTMIQWAFSGAVVNPPTAGQLSKNQDTGMASSSSNCCAISLDLYGKFSSSSVEAHRRCWQGCVSEQFQCIQGNESPLRFRGSLSLLVEGHF